MFTTKVLGLCTACTILVIVRSFPLDTITTKSGKIYKLVPVKTTSHNTFSSHNLQRTRRDVYPENINNEDLNESKKTQNNRDETDESKHDNVVAEKPGNTVNVLKGSRKEVLSVASDTLYPVVYRIRRASYSNRRKYDSSEDDDGDSNYAGYDRIGSDVGYMDANDDFPTVA